MIGRSAAAALDVHLRTELWRRIEEHLADGRTLATERQFRSAIESAYRDVTGETPPAAVREQLRRLVHSVIADRPDTYLARAYRMPCKRPHPWRGAAPLGSGPCATSWDGLRTAVPAASEDSWFPQ